MSEFNAIRLERILRSIERGLKREYENLSSLEDGFRAGYIRAAALRKQFDDISIRVKQYTYRYHQAISVASRMDEYNYTCTCDYENLVRKLCELYGFFNCKNLWA